MSVSKSTSPDGITRAEGPSSSGKVEIAKSFNNGGKKDSEAPRENENAKDSTLDFERKKEESSTQTVSILSLFAFADWRDFLLIFVGTVSAIVTGAAMPAMTIFFGDLLNAFGQNTSDTHRLVREVSKVALYYVYLGAASAVAAYLEVACWMIAGERQATRIRSKYLRAILRQDVSYFDTDTSTGEVVTRMSGDIVLIQDALGDKVGKFIQLFAAFVGGYIVAFIKSWELTLVMMATMPVVVVTASIMGVSVSRMSDRAQAAYAEAGTLVEQVVSSIRTVASYTGEKKALQDYDRNLNRAEKAGIWQGLVNGVGLGFLIANLFAAYALALWYGSKLVLNKGFSGGRVISVIFAVLTGSMSLGQASPSLTAIAAGQAAAFKIFEVIDRKPPIDVYDQSGLVPEKLMGDVELRKVEFHYPTRPDVAVFSNFSLVIPAGKTVALVGESGSGKSTVISLIERFYDPDSGAVLVDGVDIKTLQLKWLRQQIGLVSQEPVLFSTTIKENIAYGKENATMQEIETAAVLANAANFITRIAQVAPPTF